MTNSKVSTKELLKRMKTTRRRPHKSELIEKFNKIIELDEQERQHQERKSIKKTARPPEVDI